MRNSWSVFLLILLLSQFSAGPLLGQEPDPCDVVVMLKWHDYLGDEHIGAGIIVDQGDAGTLIVTARHNLVDPIEGELSQDMTVELRMRPGQQFPAEVVYLSTRHDLGLIRVPAQHAAPALPGENPLAILNLTSRGDQGVFVVGYGGGVPWAHPRTPAPARFASVASIVIESTEVKPGHSGGAVFDRDWGLIGMVFETEGAEARALPIGLVLDEIRSTRYGVTLAPSAGAERAAARRELGERRIDWSVGAVADALASADFEVLGQFLIAGAEPSLLLEALGSAVSDGRPAALTFFERTRGENRVAHWLRTAMDAGMNPNGTVPAPPYERSGLLHLAIEAGNAPAAMALLDGGASPHAYQSLWFTRPLLPGFLFPLHAVLAREGFTRPEKAALLESMLEKGAVVPDVSRIKRNFSQKIALGALPGRARSLAGVMVAPNDPDDLGSTPGCRAASERDGFDWCELARSLPRRIATDPRRIAYGFFEMEIVAFLNAFDGKAYFLGLETDTYAQPLDLVEVTRDGRVWHVYRHMSPQPGLGLCPPEQDGYRPDECWRRLAMTYEPENNRVMLQDYYVYQAFPQRNRK